MKQGTSLLLALLLVLSLVAFTPSASAADKIEFEFYHGVGGDMAVVLEDIVKAFNESQDTYVCKPVFFSEYAEAFKGYQAALAAKQPPALLLGGVDLSEAKKGIFADVLPLIAEDPSFPPLTDYVDAYVDQCTYEGKMLMLPFYGTAWMMFYSMEAFDQAGIDAETALDTWEGLEEAARKLTRVENGETVFWGWEPMYSTNVLYNTALSNGGKVLSEDGKTILVSTDEWVQAWEYFRRAVHDDKIMTIHYGGQGWEYWYKTMDDVLEGRAGGYIGSAGDLKELDWTKVKAHVLPGFEKIGPAAPELSCLKLAINASSPVDQQKGALEFYKFFSSPDNGALWSMKTGYIPANKKAVDAPAYKEYLKTAPYMKVAFDSVLTGQKPYDDPTNGKIWHYLSIAADQVWLENISAKDALDEAAANIQAELDAVA